MTDISIPIGTARARRPDPASPRIDLADVVRREPDGTHVLELAIDGVSCASCLPQIEGALARLPGLDAARMNLSRRRVTARWRDPGFDPSAIVARLRDLGFAAHPFLTRDEEEADAREMARLLRCLGVAAFATMNVMLLSVSVWSGNVSDITDETRDLFHWLSALIALPAAAYAGRPFFESAARAIRGRRLNMDVPISLGVILALGLSVSETLRGAHHAYFDSAVMLLTFLLAGRTLDQMMRRRTRAEAANLAALRGETAARLKEDGAIVEVPVAAIRPGERVLIRPGERVSIDGRVLDGTSEVDPGAVTGETKPARVGPGQMVFAGYRNFDGALTIEATASAETSLIDEARRMMEAALETRSGYRRLADRVARLYAPVVHLTALLTLGGWLLAGAGLREAIVVAVAVLIITCPCALALAVPAVQVVASGALFRRGLLLQAGDALERIAVCDVVVLDKTGTLTTPEPRIANRADIPDDLMAMAARLAASSSHPLSAAILAASPGAVPIAGASETRGEGVRALVFGLEASLGGAAFCAAQEETTRALAADPDATPVVIRYGPRVAVLLIRQILRADAAATVAALRATGLSPMIVSGDAEGPTARVAAELRIDDWRAGVTPAGKAELLSGLIASGRKPLMVGDGLNDAPALAAAHASISPATAAHLSRTAADVVFLGDRLAPVAEAVRLSRRSRRLMSQNLWFSVVYNAVAVPLAIAGLATPLVAALAMSGSSALVTLNALRAEPGRRAQP